MLVLGRVIEADATIGLFTCRAHLWQIRSRNRDDTIVSLEISFLNADVSMRRRQQREEETNCTLEYKYKYPGTLVLYSVLYKYRSSAWISNDRRPASSALAVGSRLDRSSSQRQKDQGVSAHRPLPKPEADALCTTSSTPVHAN